MKRHFGLIVTRLAILSLIAIAILIGRDALVKRFMVSKVQSWLGAKADFGQLHCSFRDSKIYMRDVAIADPRDPMTNLIQAESATLHIDLDSLARKKFVIDEATASRVFFAAPRTLPGHLSPEETIGEPNQEDSQSFELTHDPSNARHEWLDRFEHSTNAAAQPGLKVTEAANHLLARWNTDLQQQGLRVDDLKEKLRTIHGLVQTETNPLRRKQLLEAESLLSEMESEIRQLTTSLAELDQKVIQDRDLLANAKTTDEKQLLHNANLKQLNGRTLTKILLHEYQLQRTQEILEWYYGFREFIPDPSSDFLTQQTHGEVWPIPGYKDSPGLHIKNIQLDGEGRIWGSSFNFSGTAQNITSDPDALDVPTTIELRAQGKAHAFVNCTLDRRNSQRNDSISIRCPDLPLDARTLGDEKSLGITVSPCRTNVDMSLQCKDGKLAGSLRFDHSNLIMQIEYLDTLAGGEEVANRINLELASISDFSVVTSISGTVERPFVSIESNLGDRLASKFNEIMGNNTLAAENRIRKSYDTALTKLNSDVSEEIRRISQRLQDEVIAQRTRVAQDVSKRLQRNSLDSRILR